MKKLQCEMCGNTELEKRGDSYVCSVCGTEYVEEENNENTYETMIYDFSVEEKECSLSVKEWLIQSDYAPDDVLAKSKFEPMEKVFLPMYVFSGNYTANWTADSGYNREEIYTDYEEKYVTINGQSRWIKEPVTKKRTVTDWHPSSGTVSGTFAQFAVANDTVKRSLANYLETNLIPAKDYVSFEDFDKEGKNILPYTMDENKGFRVIESRLNEKIDDNVCNNIPGDTFRNSKWSADEQHESQKFYYPAYIGKYEYNGNVYSYIVDGRNVDNVYGTRPTDQNKEEKVKKLIQPLKWTAIFNNILLVIGLINVLVTGGEYGKVWVWISVALIAFTVKWYFRCKNIIDDLSIKARNKRIMFLKVLHNDSLTDEQKEARINNLANGGTIEITSGDISKYSTVANNSSDLTQKVQGDALIYLIAAIAYPIVFLLFGMFFMWIN